MPYAPPLIKPPLPPLRPPVPFPYRPPGPNRLPPTQTAPIYQPPDLLPPTGLDLKGIICIYSNAPVWELKKIRYKYPGEAWQEIVGDHYSCQAVLGGYGQVSRVWIYGTVKRCFRHTILWDFTQSGSDGVGPIEVTGKILGIYLDYLPSSFGSFFTDLYFLLETAPNTFSIFTIVSATNRLSQSCYTEDPFSPFADNIDKSTNNVRIARYEGETEFEFKVFDISNQEILSITREDCPEVIVVPERCYFRPENERLVARWIVGFLEPPLRVEYQGHCATVWKDGIIDLPPYPLQIYKECSDNPNCPPPRIRFDKKCEEKCEQCPSGTTVRVLLGNRIACVDAFGCVKKMIKYKPGCNVYDCVCG